MTAPITAMQPPLVKLCGLFREADIQVANRVRPDFVGFTFATSPRRITPLEGQKFRDVLDSSIPAVGVFQDDDLAVAEALAQAGVIQVIQLHGHESDADIRRLRDVTGLPVWKAFAIRTVAEVTAANACPADMVVLDSGSGTGRTFNWSVLAHVTRPYFLAGGLTSENVGQAVADLHPYGVDVSSGIETGHVKDPHKMQSFVENARGAAFSFEAAVTLPQEQQ